jgi:mannose-6-phosphate isomerase-like protein (cupin superfamily)
MTRMNVINIQDAEAWFQVLHTTKQSQSAVMTLKPHGESSEDMNVHEKSDQVVFIVEGEIEAEIGGEKRKLTTGDTCIIPAGTPHRLINGGAKKAVTFNVYTPPEYSAHSVG